MSKGKRVKQKRAYDKDRKGWEKFQKQMEEEQKRLEELPKPDPIALAVNHNLRH